MRNVSPTNNERFKLEGDSFEGIMRRIISEPVSTSHGADGRLAQIAAIVCERRAQLGWSRRRLAALSDVNQDTIKHLEDGDRLPRRQTLTKMAEALEVRFPV